MKKGRFRQRLQVEVVFQDRFDALEGGRTDAERAEAGRFASRIAIVFAEAQDTEAGAEALLGMAAALENVGDELGGRRAGFVGPGDEALGRPLRVLTVRPWHVCGDRGVAMLVGTAVARDPLAAMEDLDGIGGEPRLDGCRALLL